MLSLRAIDPDPFAQFDLVSRRTALAAVSGGSDSTALLLLLQAHLARHAPRVRLVAATVDHGLRAGSAGEARAVAALSARLGVEHMLLKWDGPKPVSGLAAAAREARYELLAQAAGAAGADMVMTGHSADDQAETVLMRAVRGSGTGLAGMAPATLFDGRCWIARPLLGLRRAALRALLQEAGIGWIDDPSNVDERFERPRLRAGLGEAEIARALATAMAAGSEREALSAAGAELLRRHATMASPGLLRLAPDFLQRPPEAAAIHALRVLLAIAGGAPRLPDAARTAALAARLAAGPSRATMSGSLAASRRDGVWLCRETRGLPEPRRAVRGDVWDGRYRISAGPSAVNCMIVTAGRALPATADRRSDLPAGMARTALSGLPVFTRSDVNAPGTAPHPYPLPVSDGERESSTSMPPSPRSLRGGGKGEGQHDVFCHGPVKAEDWAATPVLAPWARFLPGFDLEIARAAAALVGAEDIPPSPWRGHIVTRA